MIRNNSGCSRNVLGMLMEAYGCTEQLDPFCGLLIIEHLLMAWMFRQQDRPLVVIRLSLAVMTHVAVPTCTYVLKHVSVCMSELLFFCFAICIGVCLRIRPCVYVSAWICVCGMYVPVHAWICFCTYARRLCLCTHKCPLLLSCALSPA